MCYDGMARNAFIVTAKDTEDRKMIVQVHFNSEKAAALVVQLNEAAESSGGYQKYAIEEHQPVF